MQVFHGVRRAVPGNVQGSHGALLPGAVVAHAAGHFPDSQRGLDCQGLASNGGEPTSFVDFHACTHVPVDVNRCTSLLPVQREVAALLQEKPQLSFRAPSTHAEVNDVRWHPTRAGVFVSVLGNSRAELWDVCRSVLEPVAVFVREGETGLRLPAVVEECPSCSCV